LQRRLAEASQVTKISRANISRAAAIANGFAATDRRWRNIGGPEDFAQRAQKKILVYNDSRNYLFSTWRFWRHGRRGQSGRKIAGEASSAFF
jgi:hypothetical protein